MLSQPNHIAETNEGKYCPTQDRTSCLKWSATPFVFDWQERIDQQPGLAGGPLLDAFVRSDADWSFVKREPGWDDNTYAPVGLFMFSRESIEGRQPDFAARDVLPVFRRLLMAVAPRAATKFWFDVTLPRAMYDFPTSTFRFANVASSGHANGFVDKLDILPTHNSPRELIDLPEAARTTANYSNPIGQPEGYPPLPVLNGVRTGILLPNYRFRPWRWTRRGLRLF